MPPTRKKAFKVSSAIQKHKTPTNTDDDVLADMFGKITMNRPRRVLPPSIRSSSRKKTPTAARKAFEENQAIQNIKKMKSSLKKQTTKDIDEMGDLFSNLKTSGGRRRNKTRKGRKSRRTRKRRKSRK